MDFRNGWNRVGIGLLLLAACCLFGAPVWAQQMVRRVAPAPGEAKRALAKPLPLLGGCLEIPDDTYDGSIGSMVCVNVADPNTGQAVSDANVTLVAQHSWVGDLVVKAVSPGGTVATLMSRPGLAELADDGSGCCGDSSNLSFNSPITFDDQGGGPPAEAMGGDLDTDQVVCQDDGQCSFASVPGAAVGAGLADFNGLFSSGGNWQVCVGDSGPGATGVLCVATIELATGSPGDLSMTKTAPDGVVVDMGTYSFLLEVANAGPADHATVTVTDSLPANVTFTGSSCGVVAVGQDITWNVGGLAAGASASCELFVANNVDGCPAIVNTAEVAGDPGVPDPSGNNSSTFENVGVGANVPVCTEGSPLAIPALDPVGLLVIGGLLASAGVVALRRQRGAQLPCDEGWIGNEP